MRKSRKTNATWEYEYMFGIKQDPQPRQLWYLAASVAVIMAAFITLILL